ncbi:MAG: hypothetical protein HUJ25_15640 [Crocinitomicaceae bacterium]|nr:hypothetical protein [Crocinitomicaceae bacterium]
MKRTWAYIILSLFTFTGFSQPNYLELPEYNIYGSYYQGEIDGHNVIFYWENTEDRVEGYYFYTKYRKPIQLEGKLEEYAIYLHEKDVDASEIIELHYVDNGDVLTGSWKKDKNSDPLTVNIHRVKKSEDTWFYRWLEEFLKGAEKYQFDKPVKQSRMDFKMAYYPVALTDPSYAYSIYSKTDFNNGPRTEWNEGDYIKSMGYILRENFVVLVFACKFQGSVKPWFEPYDTYGRFIVTLGHNGKKISTQLYAGVEIGPEGSFDKAVYTSPGLTKDLEFKVDVKTTYFEGDPKSETFNYYIDKQGQIKKK